MLPSTQVRTVIASLLLVVATLVVVVPSVGLWEPPLDAPFASHVHDGHESAPATLAAGDSMRTTLDGERSAANQDRATDDRPNTASALQRSDLLAHWVLLSIVAVAVLLLAPRPRHGWAPVHRHDRVPRRPQLRGHRSWRAPPVLV